MTVDASGGAGDGASVTLSRRDVAAGLGACAVDGPRLLDMLPGPRMLSCGVIARDRRGRVAMRAADGTIFGARRAFSLDAPFRVASISKMIAAFAFQPLVRAGRIGLDDDVAAVIGRDLRHPAHSQTAITLRMLLSHMSGLRNGADYPVRFGRLLTERLEAARSEADYGGWYARDEEAPGRFFTYADVNFAVLAGVMEKVTGRRFDHFMREAVFAPHGLDIGYNWSSVSQRKRNRAAPAARSFDGVWTAQIDDALPRAPYPLVPRAPDAAEKPIDSYQLGENGFVFGPQGGLRLSLVDMDRLARIVRCDAEDLAVPQWTHDGANGETENGFHACYGLAMQRPGFGPRDGFFGADSRDWRGHCGDAYGWMTGMFWNVRDGRTLVYALNGMPETGRMIAARTALTAAEQALVDAALARIG